MALNHYKNSLLFRTFYRLKGVPMRRRGLDVLANLVKNGIEAMRTTPPDERIVSVGARLDADGRVQIRVSDRGCGLGDTTVQQLFAPFFTTKSNGMGVGLAICRSIVEFHEGNLYFEDNPEGGATFVFTLPAASQEAEQP